MDVANPREHVMNHVEVEASQKPVRKWIATSIISCSIENMLYVIVRDVTRFIRFRKGRVLGKMVWLKRDCECETEAEMHNDKCDNDRIPWHTEVQTGNNKHVRVIEDFRAKKKGKFMDRVFNDLTVAEPLLE